MFLNRVGRTALVRHAGLALMLAVLAGAQSLSAQTESSARGEVAAARRPPRSPMRGVLDQRQLPLFWEGRVGPEDAPTGGEPPECADVPCDRFRLRIDLPYGTFQNPNRPGGVQVALRWFGNPGGHTLPPGVPGCCGEFDTLHLWVYKDGALVAASPGIIAVSQSAFLPEPENGWYDVWIAYDPTYNVAPFVEYEALAEVEYLPRRFPVKRLLPDLTFHGTERITFDTPSFPIFEPDPPAGASCFASETEEDGAQTCLRFDQIIANLGAGPIEIAYDVPAGATPDANVPFPVSQRVYESDGSFTDRPGGTRDLPRRARPLPLLELRQRAAVAVRPARRQAGHTHPWRRRTRSASAWPTSASTPGARRATAPGSTTLPIASFRVPQTASPISTGRASTTGGRTSTIGTSPTSTSR